MRSKTPIFQICSNRLWIPALTLPIMHSSIKRTTGSMSHSLRQHLRRRAASHLRRTCLNGKVSAQQLSQLRTDPAFLSATLEGTTQTKNVKACSYCADAILTPLELCQIKQQSTVFLLSQRRSPKRSKRVQKCHCRLLLPTISEKRSCWPLQATLNIAFVITSWSL